MSHRAKLPAGIEEGADGRRRVLSPRVGWWSGLPRPGALLAGGASIGCLRILGRRFQLRLPEDVAGRVGGGLPEDLTVPIGYGDRLFDLEPIAISVEGPAADEPEHGRSSRGLPTGMLAVVAPTDGVFYRSPTPGAPPFVEVGGAVTGGQPIGLVEVMKTFNQILYGGEGMPESAEIVEIRAADGDEVQAGDVLLVVRRVG